MPISSETLYRFYRTPTCPVCGKHDKLFLNQAEVQAYQAGELIHKAFPTLPADKREQIKTGMHGACWDALFPKEETE